MKKEGLICILTFILCVPWSLIMCQNPVNDPLEILDNLSQESLDQLKGQTGILEQLQYIASHPMDLNTMNLEDFERLPFLNPVEIKAILEYRSAFGPFVDPLELQVIEELALESIQQLLPFVNVPQTSLSANVGKGYILVRSSGYFPRRTGFKSENEKTPAYQGGPLSLLIKYRKYQSRNFSWGTSLEKDSGEPFGFKGKPGFDHVHFHYYKTGRPGKIRTIALGDYRISLGQGLLQYQGFAITKSSNPLMVKRVAPVIQPYSGTSEYNYFRGAAAEITLGSNFRNFIFLHHRKRDATQRSYDDGSEYFSAFQTSGLHRTANEESKRNQVGETVAGHRIQWQKKLWKLGLNSLYHKFSLPYQPINRIDNIHRLTGQQLFSHSLDISGYIKSLHVFGELATQNYHTPAFTLTGLYSFNSRLDGGVLIRRFPTYFNPQYGNAFSARSTPNNESGIYLGLNYHLGPYSRFSFYIDSWKGLWPTFQAHGPTFDQDIFLRYDISRRRVWKAYIQAKFKHRADNSKTTFPMYNSIVYSNQINLRLQFRKIQYQQWRWTNRLEMVRYCKGELLQEYGFLAFTDFYWSPIGTWWSLAGRLAYFDTDSYATRIYAYEPDIRYSFSIPSFYRKGWRIAARISHKWRNGLRVELRTGWSILPGAEEVGSGYNAVPGSYSQQVKMQVMYEF